MPVHRAALLAGTAIIIAMFYGVRLKEETQMLTIALESGSAFVILITNFTEAPACKAACWVRLHDKTLQGNSRFNMPLTAQSMLPVSSLPSGLHRLSISCGAPSPCVIQPHQVIKVDKSQQSSQPGSVDEAEEACNTAGACLAISGGERKRKVQVLDLRLRAVYTFHSRPMLPHLEPLLGTSEPLAFFGLLAMLTAGVRAAGRIAKVVKGWWSGSGPKCASAV